jgi:hypothetical protein
MSQRDPVVFRPTIRLYPGQDDDLIAWVEGLEGLPFGAKSQAAKEALLQGIGATSGGQATPASAAVDLAELRRVMEAAVTSVLHQFAGQIGTGVQVAEPKEDEETEELLDDLGAALVLDDDVG